MLTSINDGLRLIVTKLLCAKSVFDHRVAQEKASLNDSFEKSRFFDQGDILI